MYCPKALFSLCVLLQCSLPLYLSSNASSPCDSSVPLWLQFQMLSIFAGGKRYPDRPIVYQISTQLISPCTQLFPSCCSVFTAAFVHGRTLPKTKTCSHISNEWMRRWNHTHTLFWCLHMCGVYAGMHALGGALSRYQVVFPSAPERALIVLLFNLLVILDARQEPFSQT